MKKVAYVAILAAIALTFGCAVTNYPLITDNQGPYGNIVRESFYDKAYIIPSYGQIAFLYPTGSEELFSLVVQDWKGDQRLYTYGNLSPTGGFGGTVFLDQTGIAYCDPSRQTNCAVWTAWNPDLPDEYPFGPTGQSGDPTPSDNIFDGQFDGSCPGAQSLKLLLSEIRTGECGSGIWNNQATALEFSLLDKTTFRGQEVYSLPINSSVASVQINGDDMRIFGTYRTYLDEQLRLMVQPTPNAVYQLRALNDYVDQNGPYMSVDVTYGSATANFKIAAQGFDEALDRF